MMPFYVIIDLPVVGKA